jgi:hypothetical protein
LTNLCYYVSILKIKEEVSMLIFGYKGTPNWTEVKAAFKRCTDLPPSEIEKAVKQIRLGATVQIPNDFVLHDELKELGILVK